MAECIRTFPTVTLPASLLLKREEIEKRKLAGASVIAAVHDSKYQRSRAYMEPPVDLLYGLRGRQENVDLLSSYEMLMHWSMEKILPPSLKIPQHAQKSCLTPEGLKLKKQCQNDGVRPDYQAGAHFKVVAADARILMPDLAALRSLQDRWCWERRPLPHVPVRSFAKVPRASFSLEESARLLSVYMRPWSLNPSDATASNPLLSELGTCVLLHGYEEPISGMLPLDGRHSTHNSGTDLIQGEESGTGLTHDKVCGRCSIRLVRTIC
jgi:hypothetical protein